MRKREIKKQLEKLTSMVERLEKLSIMILNSQKDSEKTDSATLLNEYLMGDSRNEN